MASSRAEEVAEILWELKRAEKVGKFSSIARRAGFSAGANGRAMQTTLRTVRRDWPHLQWWRAVSDTGCVEKGSEHEEKLREAGFEMSDAKEEDIVEVTEFDVHILEWEEATEGDSATT